MASTYQLVEHWPRFRSHWRLAEARQDVGWAGSDQQSSWKDGQDGVVKHHAEIKLLAVLRTKDAIIGQPSGFRGRLRACELIHGHDVRWIDDDLS